MTLLVLDPAEGTIKMTENEVYGVSLEAVQKSEESIELKQNQVYGIHAGHQQQGSEDILVQPNVVYGVRSGGDNSERNYPQTTSLEDEYDYII